MSDFERLKTLITKASLLLLLLGVPVISNPGYAQQLERDNIIDADLQSWTQITLTGPLSPNKKVLGFLEVQPRTSLLGAKNPGPIAVLLLRSAVGYAVKKNVSVWQGYAWVPSFEEELVNENRIFQQLLVTNKFKKLDVVNRTRLEQRLIAGAGGTSVRARHLLRGAYPLFNSPKWSGVLYNEFFVNLNSTPNGPLAGVDQNRSFVGLNRKFNEHANMDFGYMADFVNFRNKDRLNHIILLTLNFRTN